MDIKDIFIASKIHMLYECKRCEQTKYVFMIFKQDTRNGNDILLRLRQKCVVQKWRFAHILVSYM